MSSFEISLQRKKNYLCHSLFYQPQRSLLSAKNLSSREASVICSWSSSAARHLILFHVIASPSVSELRGVEAAQTHFLFSYSYVCAERQGTAKAHGTHTAEYSSTGDTPYAFHSYKIYSLALQTQDTARYVLTPHREHGATVYVTATQTTRV